MQRWHEMQTVLSRINRNVNGVSPGNSLRCLSGCCGKGSSDHACMYMVKGRLVAVRYSVYMCTHAEFNFMYILHGSSCCWDVAYKHIYILRKNVVRTCMVPYHEGRYTLWIDFFAQHWLSHKQNHSSHLTCALSHAGSRQSSRSPSPRGSPSISEKGAYVVQAGRLIKKALSYEKRGEYQEAFDLFKAGVDVLLNGVQSKKPLWLYRGEGLNC